LASVKVDGLAKEIVAASPVAWQTVMAGRPPAPGDLAEIGKALAHEQGETQVALLKIYGRDRRAVYSSDPGEIGVVEDNPALVDALVLGGVSVGVKWDAKDNNAYEFYTPSGVDASHVGAVFDLYEPIARFDRMLWNVVRPVLVIPAALFAFMLFGLTWL